MARALTLTCSPCSGTTAAAARPLCAPRPSSPGGTSPRTAEAGVKYRAWVRARARRGVHASARPPPLPPHHGTHVEWWHASCPASRTAWPMRVTTRNLSQFRTRCAVCTAGAWRVHGTQHAGRRVHRGPCLLTDTWPAGPLHNAIAALLHERALAALAAWPREGLQPTARSTQHAMAWHGRLKVHPCPCPCGC